MKLVNDDGDDDENGNNDSRVVSDDESNLNNNAKKKGKKTAAKGKAKQSKATKETPEEAAAREAALHAVKEMETILTMEREVQQKSVDIAATLAYKCLGDLDKTLKGLCVKQCTQN